MKLPDANLSTRCPKCGAPLSTSIDGMCGACLMRLAAIDPESAAEEVEGPSPALFEDWLKVKGQRIGNYELLDEIARGGMGIVYRARQVAASRTVALKLMLPHLLYMPGMRQRFRHEVEAVAQLDHPGILPIYEVAEHAGLPFFSMKFAEGHSLDRRREAFQGQWQKIAAIVAKVASAVEHAHRKGLLHRDLKPANILFDAQEQPMVADFGLAKFRAIDRELTMPAATFGSPNYMAPEQISAQFGELGPATDVYGIGAVLYELLTGLPPIVAKDAVETMRLVPIQVPKRPQQVRADVPEDLETIALKCLAKQPAQRYASASQVAQDLESWLSGAETSARRAKRAARARHWVARAAAAAAVVVVAVAAGKLLPWFTGSSERSTRATAVVAAPRSIAVLPLGNVSQHREDDYLSSMVTDDLLRDLRQIASLRVVPFRVGPAEQASQLGVDLVLDGDYERHDNLFTVRARLWDTKTKRSIWEHTFNTPLQDVREMRSSIANALVTRLQIEVGSDLRAQLGRDAMTKSPVAYSNYLRARYLLRWRRHETLTEAARLLREAIALDDSFAQAHSALAYVYALWVSPAPPEGEHWELAVKYANSAIARDGTLGEPHAVLADAHTIDNRPVEAERSFRKALELDPHDPATLHFYAIQLYSMGRLRDALDMERRSVANDSASPQPLMWLAMLTTLIGDQEEARELWRKTDELGAARPLCAAVARLELGQTEFLSEWYRTRADEAKLPPSHRDATLLFEGVTDPSKRTPALQWLREIEATADPAFLITQYGMLGDADGALRVAASYDIADDFYYLYQLCNIWSPRTASIRTDPRFGDLARRWSFVDYWKRVAPADACSVSGDEVRCR